MLHPTALLYTMFIFIHRNVTLDKTRSPQSQLNDSNDSFDDENEDEFTVIGECTALYAFPGKGFHKKYKQVIVN
jgi:hypothetical protein